MESVTGTKIINHLVNGEPQRTGEHKLTVRTILIRLGRVRSQRRIAWPRRWIV